MINIHLKHSQAPPYLDMFPTMERKKINTIDVEMNRSLNDGDFLIAYKIIKYIGL